MSKNFNTILDQKEKFNLKCAYLILAKLGLDDHTYTHLSCRPLNADYYYIYPFGLKFSEVTEEKLLKVSLSGEILEGQEYQYNKTGYIIHGSIYTARPEITSIFHVHTIATVAVSSIDEGLMPLSQWSLHFYDNVSYHEYNSLALDLDLHGIQISKDLGKNYILFLRNHGLITCGRTIHETMFYTYHLEQACKCQIAILSMNKKLVILPKEKCIQAHKDLISFEQDLGMRDWLAWLREFKLC